MAKSTPVHKSNPLLIFILAEQFRATAVLTINVPIIPLYYDVANILPLHGVRGLYNPTAYMVNKAFALELYFKCPIRIGRKNYGREHDLRSLFNRIGKRRQAQIKSYWKDKSDLVVHDIEQPYIGNGRAVPKVDFEFFLNGSKDAFQQMRYAYEGIEPDTGWMGDTIVESARQVILDMRPTWERQRQAFPNPLISVYPPHS